MEKLNGIIVYNKQYYRMLFNIDFYIINT